MGRDQVSKAINGISPWKSLKQLANLQKPIVQLVLPDELAAAVSERKASPKNKAGKKTMSHTPKGTKAHPVKPLDINSNRLVLAEETFCLGDGTGQSDSTASGRTFGHRHHAGIIPGGIAVFEIRSCFDQPCLGNAGFE